MASGGGARSFLGSSTYPSDSDSPDYRDVSNRFHQLSTRPSEGELFSNTSTDTKPQSSGGTVISNLSTEPSDSDDTPPSTTPSSDSKTINNVLLYSNAQKIKNINVMISGDKLNSCITGCCFMPGGELVLYDFGNKKIKRLGSSLSVVNSLDIPGGDWDTAVAAIDNNNVIVTIADKKHVQFIQVIPSLKIGRSIDVGRYCNGVAAAAGKIFLLCESTSTKDEIRVYDLEGKDMGERHVINLSGTNVFVSPFYVAVSRSGDKIFISDRDTHRVSCLSSNGDILYQYGDDGLQRPCGLFVDDKDNAMVCGDYSHTVEVIAAPGKKHQTLLTSKDGISNPICVSLRPLDGTLVVGCWDNNNLFVYKLA